jgi:class 3 adenylate cyclase
MPLNEILLDERLAQLEKARPWTPRVVSKLESHIRQAGDEALFRINPLTFAAEKNIPVQEAIDLFLYAAKAGLFGMDWLLLCPPCACVVESFRSLKGVHNHYHCNICQVGYETSLDDLIAITFTVAADIRDIVFHHPETLSASDYLFKYGGTGDARLPDGTPFNEVKKSVTRAITYLPPRETTLIETEITEGTLLGVSAEGRLAAHYTVDGPFAAGPQTIKLRFGDKVSEHERGKLRPGKVTFMIENMTDARGTFAAALLPPGMTLGSAPVTFVPYLTGKRLLTTQAFRDLFRSEVIAASEGLSVKDIALLFTDLKGSTALYDRIGDLNAFALVQQHFDRLQAVTARHHGAIVKTIGDAVMAAFIDPGDAVKAALEMRDAIADFNRGQPDRALILKIGLHKGAAIAVTLNDRLDYFGQTVNIAARVQNLADADEIYISGDVFESEGVRTALASFAVDESTAQLRGIREGVQVFRIPASARILAEPLSRQFETG